jgi:hypothetical protein
MGVEGVWSNGRLPHVSPSTMWVLLISSIILNNKLLQCEFRGFMADRRTHASFPKKFKPRRFRGAIFVSVESDGEENTVNGVDKIQF